MAKKTFDEVVLFARTGLNPRNNFKLGNGDNKYITIKNIHDGELVIDDNTDVVSDEAINLIHKRSQIKKGDILFCSIGRIGDMYIIENEPEGWDINESVFAFTLNSDIIYQKYFYYIFKNQNTIRLISKNSSGSTFKSIKMNQIKKMVFELPPLEEQKKVINILDNLSLIIKNFEKELKKLDELTKARFVEMFGNPIFNEKGFETKPGSDIFNLSNGKFVPESKRFEDGIPVYGGNGVSWYTDEVLFENDTIVVGRVGFQSGNVHLVKGPLWISDNAMYVSNLFDDGFDLRFLYFVMEHIDFTRFQDAGDLRKITQKPFMVMRYIMPPLRMQLDYISFVAQIDKSKLSSDIVQRISDMQYNVH